MWAPLARLLEQCDVVTLHVPSTDETRGMIGPAEFGRMRPGAILVNTARGDLVDERAMIDSLAAGHLGGAGLDVFAREPRVPGALIEHPRVVTLPHLGSATTSTRRAMAELAVANVRSVLAGGEALTPVDD